MESTTKINQVAGWMVDTLKAKGSLYYRPTLQLIRQQFGPAYVRVNLRGNAVISAEVPGGVPNDWQVITSFGTPTDIAGACAKRSVYGSARSALMFRYVPRITSPHRGNDMQRHRYYKRQSDLNS